MRHLWISRCKFYITDDVSEYFLQFLAYFYNQEVGKSLESVFYPAQIITTTHLNKDDVVTMKMITLPLMRLPLRC